MRMRTWVILGIAGAIGSYAIGHPVYLAMHPHTSRAQAYAAHPAPALFSRTALAPYAPAVAQESPTAARLMNGWWSTHNAKLHDRQFGAWLRAALPSAPTATARSKEVARLEKLALVRATSGLEAAKWLDVYAARDFWQFREQKDAATVGAKLALEQRRELTTMLTLGSRVGAALEKQRQQSAPYVIDPALRPGYTPNPRAVCPCSYPSRAVVDASAGRTLMSYFHPQQSALYQHMVDELAFGQLYAGTHLPSDVDAGALLGDMIGQYFLVTRNHVDLSGPTAAVAAG
jgi:membrane-associated phospholipid phosphatase